MRILFFLFLAIPILSTAQVNVPDEALLQQLLEQNTAANDDQATEDDAALRALAQYQRQPIDLNKADVQELERLGLFTALQISALKDYVKIFGAIETIYELQAIPLWYPEMIRSILPYVSIGSTTNTTTTLFNRLKKGRYQFLLRISQIAEPSKGFQSQQNVNDHFAGSAQHVSLRFNYQYKNLLEYGIVADKDAGEKWFGKKSGTGFDFYSAHLFIRKLGWIKTLAIGDFTVNMGQGLIHWQSLAFGKGAAISGIVRQSDVFRPYHSFAETNFHRGLAIGIGKGKWEGGLFFSKKAIDANKVIDSLNNGEEAVTAFQTSGLHRTPGELADKGSIKQMVAGGSIKYRHKNWQVGIQAIRQQFNLPVQKGDAPYQLYQFEGKKLNSMSADYRYRIGNLLLFGEAAYANKKWANLHGILLSVASKADLSMIYRQFNPAFPSFQSRAFSENSRVNNESGYYCSIDLRPESHWQILAYMDFFKFPWLKYRVNSHSTGQEQQIQLIYRPNKKTEWYIRYKRELKAINENDGSVVIPYPENILRRNLRMHLNFSISSDWELRWRAEWVLVKGNLEKQGFAWYSSLHYNPMMKPYSANFRVLFFDTDDYDTRIYAYENNVLYSYAIPVIYDKGFRYYLNLHYTLNKQHGYWIRWAQTIYQNKMSIGSGSDEIQGNKRSAIQLQWIWQF
jgi:hypothetical protein